MISHLAGVRADGLSFIQRQDVEMQMEYRLPRSRFIILSDLHAIGIERSFCGAGNFLHRGHERSERRKLCIQ